MKPIEIELHEDKKFSEYMFDLHQMSEKELLTRFPQFESIKEIWKDSLPKVNDLQISIFDLLFEVITKLKQHPNYFIIEREIDSIKTFLCCDTIFGNHEYFSIDYITPDILTFDSYKEAEDYTNTIPSFLHNMNWKIVEYYYCYTELDTTELLFNYIPKL